MRKYPVIVLCFFLCVLVALVLFCSKKSPTAPEVQDYTGTISGYVYSRLDGKPLSEIIVSINADSSHPAVTTPSGYFEIGSVKAGTHELHFTGVDYEDTAGITVTLLKGQELTLHDTVRLTYKYYILTGVIKYGSSPIPGAGVAVGNTPISSLVGTDGKYTLDRVPKSQDIELICAKSKIGFATYQVTNAAANIVTKVPDIVLKDEGAIVSGTIYDTAGNPMKNVIVAAVGGGLVDTTDAYGNYHLENVPDNMDIRIFVPGQEGLSGAVTGLIAANGANLSGVDIHLRPVVDLSSGNGMALTVNDFLVIDTTKIARLSVYPTTNDTTVITGYRWTLAGSKTATVTTTAPVLPVSTDTLEKMGQPGNQGIIVKVTVVSISSRNLESKPQTFQVLVSSNKPVVFAQCSDSANGHRNDSVSIEAGGWVWLFGHAFAPFGGIDTLIWDFGDSTPARRNSDTLSTVSHKYSRVGTFMAIFSAVYGGGRVSDTVIVKATSSPIPTPVLVSPPDKDTNRTAADSVTLVWNSVAGIGITYNVYFDPNNNPPAVAVAQAMTDTSLRVKIDSGVSCFWAVEAVNSGKTGPQAKAWLYNGRIGKKPTNLPPVFATKPADMRDTAIVGVLYKDTVTATDPNATDTITYSFLDSVGGMKLAAGIITWTPVPADSGSKNVSVLASDGHGGKDTLSWKVFVRFTDSIVNGLMVSPKNDSLLAGWDVLLTWSIPDTASAQLWMGVHPDSLAPIGNYGQSVNYRKTGLQGNVSYYWRLSIKYTNGSAKWTPVWRFVAGNHAPEIPQLVSPANGAKVVVPFKLAWTCRDSDAVDTLLYDIYFGKANPPPKIASKIKALSYDVTSVPDKAVYFWRVGVSDGKASLLSDSVYALSAISADTIQAGAVRTDSLGQGEIKVYQFKGQAGDLITIRVNTLNGYPYPGLQLQSADGQVLKNGYYSVGGTTANFINDFKLPATGSYTVFITAHPSYGGKIQVRIINRTAIAAAATVITPGQKVADTLLWGEIKAYKFSSQAGHLVRVAGYATPLVWFDTATKNSTRASDFTSQKLDTVRTSGDQILYADALSAPWAGTGCTFRVFDVSDVKDTLKSGDTASADLAFPFDCKPFTFKGKAGDFITFRTNATTGNPGTGIQVFAMTGQFVKSGDWSQIDYNAVTDARLPATGVYSVLFASGQYYSGSIRIRCINRSAVAAGAAAISFGQAVKDSLSWGEMRAYTLTGQAGHLVFMAGKGQVSWFDTVKGQPVPLSNYGLQKLDTLKSSGPQVVYVDASTAPWTGTAYSFRLLDISGTADTLGHNDTAHASVTIPGDCKPFLFKGNAGDLVTFRTNTLSGNPAPGFQLFSPGGQFLASSNWGPGSASYNFANDCKLPATGTYSILIGSYMEAGTMQVRLINRRALADSAAAISFGQTVTDTLRWGEIRAYKMSAQANHLVMLAGNGPVCWYDSAGKQSVPLATFYQQKLDTLKSTGNQVVYVDAQTAPWSGTAYSFRVLDVSGTVDTLKYNDTAHAAMTIPKDCKPYLFQGQAGDLVSVRINTLTGNPYSGIQLFSPAGKFLTAGTWGAGSYAQNYWSDFKLPSSGAYAVLVGSYNDPGTAEVRLINRKSLAAAATPISFGQLIHDTLAWGEIKAFKVAGQANHHVRMAGNGGLYWFDSVKQETVPVASRTSLRLDTIRTAGDQICYLDASSAPWAPVSCDFKLFDANAVADTLHYGDTLNLTFSSAFDTKPFVIAGAANDFASMRISDLSGSPASGLALWNPNGQLLRYQGAGNTYTEIDDDTLPAANATVLFVDNYYAGASTVRLMKTGPASPWAPGQPSDIQRSGGMVLVKANGYSFRMGNWTGSYEPPVHLVSFTKDFWIDTTEVTQGDYFSLMGVNPSINKTDSVHGPVENITWFDAALYCNARSKRDGLDTVYDYTATPVNPGNGCLDLQNLSENPGRNGYRLPAEAQWEYACRGGTSSAYYWGNSIADNELWYTNNSGNATHPVAGRIKNAYGLYDMCGNVWEMCQDSWGTYLFAPQTDPAGPAASATRVIRGGAYNDAGGTSSIRSSMSNTYQYGYIGFRVVKP